MLLDWIGMNIKFKQKQVLKSEPEYKEALARTVEIFHAEEGTPEADELGLLLILVKDFEDKYVPIPTPEINQ